MRKTAEALTWTGTRTVWAACGGGEGPQAWKHSWIDQNMDENLAGSHSFCEPT